MRELKLRARLAVIALSLTVPLAAILVTLLVTERQAALSASQDRLLRLARIAAEQGDDALVEAATLVQVLARVKEVTGGPVDACHAVLRELVNVHQRIGAISVSGPSGTIACESGSPIPRGQTVAGQPWFAQVTAPDAPAVVTSDLVVSRVTGKLTVIVATALNFAEGRGSLSAGVEIGESTTKSERLDSEAGTVVQVVSVASRTVMASSSPQLSPIGTALADGPLFKAIRGLRSGVIEDTDQDGARQIHGFAMLPQLGGMRAAVVVSRDRASVVAPADRRLIVSLGVLGAVVAVGALASIKLALVLVLRPLRQLIGIAQALGRGELGARACMSRMQDPECRSLAIALNEMAGQLAARERDLAALASRDSLTGLANRRSFDTALAEEWERSRGPIAIAIIDVDFFKSYNDRYGHQGGDNILRLVADTLAAGSRRSLDMVARYGGEEFVILMPELDRLDARLVGNRLVMAIRALEIPHAGSPTGFLTVSAGLAWLPGRGVSDTFDLIRSADEALYAAKRGGRDRVAITEPGAERGGSPSACLSQR